MTLLVQRISLSRSLVPDSSSCADIHKYRNPHPRCCAAYITGRSLALALALIRCKTVISTTLIVYIPLSRPAPLRVRISPPMVHSSMDNRYSSEGLLSLPIAVPASVRPCFSSYLVTNEAGVRRDLAVSQDTQRSFPHDSSRHNMSDPRQNVGRTLMNAYCEAVVVHVPRYLRACRPDGRL